MATEKQIKANKQNAIVSTGPVTAEGKAIAAQNAVKHGIFARDLIITAGDGKEDQGEYTELLDNLVLSLNPKGQLECILVEKIAVDYWRLRRVLRFESGSIRKFLDMAVSDYYNKADWQGKKEHKTNEQLNEKIVEQKEFIRLNNRYIRALKKGVVTFDKPVWKGGGAESNIKDDLSMIMDDIKHGILSDAELFQYEEGEIDFNKMRAILKTAGYTDEKLSKKLIALLKKQNKGYRKRIAEIENEKIKNKYAEEVAIKTSSLPADDTYEKVIKYEKAVQRSILQNLALLKRLQSMR